MRLQTYKSSSLYKNKVKEFHDKRIIKRQFKPDQPVFLFNSKLKLFLGKLRTRWSGPFIVKEVKPYGTIEIEDPTTKNNCDQWIEAKGLLGW